MSDTATETPKEARLRQKKAKLQQRIEYLRQLKTRKDLRKMGYREDGFNRTNDGKTNHERVQHQRRFREKASR